MARPSTVVVGRSPSILAHVLRPVIMLSGLSLVAPHVPSVGVGVVMIVAVVVPTIVVIVIVVIVATIVIILAIVVPSAIVVIPPIVLIAIVVFFPVAVVVPVSVARTRPLRLAGCLTRRGVRRLCHLWFYLSD